MERGRGVFCAERERENIYDSTSKADIRVVGGQDINGYIHTEGRYTRVFRMLGTLQCFMAAHKGGQERTEKRCSSVVRPSQRLWIFLSQAGLVSIGAIHNYARKCTGEGQEFIPGGTQIRISPHPGRWKRKPQDVYSHFYVLSTHLFTSPLHQKFNLHVQQPNHETIPSQIVMQGIYIFIAIKINNTNAEGDWIGNRLTARSAFNF